MKKDSLATRLVLMVNWTLGFILFRLFNFTRVYNRQGLLKETGILYVASHFTMVDSWLIGSCFNPLWLIARSQFIPWNVPEKANFYKRRLIIWWLEHSKCIPISRKAGGRDAHQEIIKALGVSNILMFPESGRRRKNQPINTSASFSKFVLKCGAQKIIPIRLTGLPCKGSFLPVIFRKIKVIVGQPLELTIRTGGNNDTYLKIACQIRDAIENLQPT